MPRTSWTVVTFLGCAAMVAACAGDSTSPTRTARPTQPSNPTAPVSHLNGYVNANGLSSHVLHVLRDPAPSETPSLTVTLTWSTAAVNLDLYLVAGARDWAIPPTFRRFVAAQSTQNTGTSEQVLYRPISPYGAAIGTGSALVIWITNSSAQAETYSVEVNGLETRIDASVPDFYIDAVDYGGSLCKAVVLDYQASSGFSAPTTLSCSGVPSGLTCAFALNSVLPIETAIQRTGMLFAIDPRFEQAPPPQQLHITSSSGGVQHTSTVFDSFQSTNIPDPASTAMLVTGCVARASYTNPVGPIRVDVGARIIGSDGTVRRTCDPVQSDYWGWFATNFGSQGCAASPGDRIQFVVAGTPRCDELAFAGGARVTTILAPAGSPCSTTTGVR